MYTKSAFPTRLSFASKPSFHLLVSIHSQQCAPHSPCQIQGTSNHLYSSIFPYFPHLQLLPFLSFLPQHLVYSSVPHVCFTSQQNTKDIFVSYYKHFFLPISLHLLQNTIYNISCYHSPASPSKIMLTLFFKFLLQHPSPTVQIHFTLPITFFIYVLIFHIQNSLPEVQSSPLSFFSTTTSITICAVLHSVRGCSVLFKFW